MTAAFWNTIKVSGGDAESLKVELTKLSDADLTVFRSDYFQALINLNKWEIWGAGYVMAGGMSDDSFHYFRSWIIGNGQECYETALSAPDDLGAFASEEHEFENELFEYSVIDLLEERGLPDPADQSETQPDDEPSGEPWDEDTVCDLYPKLAKQFG